MGIRGQGHTTHHSLAAAHLSWRRTCFLAEELGVPALSIAPLAARPGWFVL